MLAKPAYRLAHDGLNFAYRKSWTHYGGKRIGKGHISDEHLQNPTLDDALEADLIASGIPVSHHTINQEGYWKYRKAAPYPPDYFGGGNDPKRNFTEKTLEHYLSSELKDLSACKVLVDVAAATSPWAEVAQHFWPHLTTWKQDLVYPKNQHTESKQLGGYAHEMNLPSNHVDLITLHCSLEHFEGNSDSLFFETAQRVLAPGGTLIIHPFYIASEYTIHIDPAYNLLHRHRPQLDPQARLRIASWYQYFSRHYDVSTLKSRILQHCPQLQPRLVRIDNFRDVAENCYLRWVLLLEKPE